MGGEWALGVALVTEMWPDRSRALLAGLIGAAANVGYLIVGLISLVLVSFIEWFRQSAAEHRNVAEHRRHARQRRQGWRLMMIVGALPALLMFFIMRIVPESHKWEAERDKGATSHWATRDLVGCADRRDRRGVGRRDVVAGVPLFVPQMARATR